MKWTEASPLSMECNACAERECYNCDVSGQRWTLSKEDELRTTRKLLVRAIERMKRKIAEIDLQLQELNK